MEFTEKDNGKTIHLVSMPFDFRVILSENPTTGYVWEIGERPDHIKILGQDLLSSKEIRAGSAATRIFKFSIQKMNGGTLNLLHCRPWDKLDRIDSFELHFTVGKK